MFTKDISFEDCILDLIDNSIDGFIQSTKLNLGTLSSNIFKDESDRKNSGKSQFVIQVELSEERVIVKDNCGGIDIEYARNEAFNFGHGADWKKGTLGVYGIGLKRALFKIGNTFDVSSRTLKNGFTCQVNVKEWVKKDKTLDDWRLPLIEKKGVSEKKKSGTNIEITNLHDEVKARIKGGVEVDIYDSISRTYSFYLNDYISIKLIGKKVEAYQIPIGKPKEGTVSFEEFNESGVNVKIIASIAQPDKNEKYKAEHAGWYIVCNGRVVLDADKSKITGWGNNGMPSFQPKHRSFIGIVFFESEDPLRLPWTTTKRALNKESSIYIPVRLRMISAARPIMSFINKQYPSDVEGDPYERDIRKDIESVVIGGLINDKDTVFTAPVVIRRAKTTTTVKYEADNSDLNKIRTHIRKGNLAAYKVGSYTFQYYLKQEGLK